MQKLSFNRALSKAVTSVLLRTPLTPNPVTLMSLAAGIFAGFLFSKGSYAASLAAAFFYECAIVLDNCDGEIARAKNMKSAFGARLDVLADLSTDAALFLGLAFGVARSYPGPWVVWTTAACLSGLFFHFLLVTLESKKGFGPAVFETPNPDAEGRRHIWFRIFDALREGEASWFVVFFALIGKTEWLFACAAAYMQALWLGALWLNAKWLLRGKPS